MSKNLSGAYIEVIENLQIKTFLGKRGYQEHVKLHIFTVEWII